MCAPTLFVNLFPRLPHPSLHIGTKASWSVVQGAQACLRGLGSLAREFSQINIYDIYVDFCLRGQQPSAQRLAQASGYDPRLLGPWAAAMGESHALCRACVEQGCSTRMPAGQGARLQGLCRAVLKQAGGQCEHGQACSA